MFNMIKKICLVPGISGREFNVGEVIRKEIEPYVDLCSYDAMGNLIAFKKGTSGNGKKLMYAAHMDEIGFIATYIEDNGFIRFACVGGINLAACAFSYVVFENGVKGVIVPESGVGANDYRSDKFVIDIGTSSKKETEKKIKIGDFFVIEADVKRIAGKKIAGRPLDDRIACAVMVEAAKSMKNCVNDTYFVFTVQEEVGCRGAHTAAFGIMPDKAVAFDVTATGDSQGAKQMAVKLGGGAAIKIKDSSVICDVSIVEEMKNLAKANSIKYQLEILLAGGTDTSSMQAAGAGCIAGAISIPCRYIHSAVEMCDLRDVEECVKLAVAIIETEIL